MMLMERVSLSLILACTLVAGCGGTEVKTVDLSKVKGANVDQLYIVDCLLPGSVRQLGTKLTYLGARRVIKTTGSECAIRGGEYVAHDRANFKTALKVWLPLAQGGDPKAQTYVGEIYEKGYGTQPNYAQAANWYQKAANQGFARAKMSLGSLYERGLGVSRSNSKALNLYRDASGLGARQVEFVSVAQRQARVAQTKQLAQTRREVQIAQNRTSQLQREVQQLRAEAQKLKNSPPKVEVRTIIKTVPAKNSKAGVEQKQPKAVKTRVAAIEKKIVTKEKEIKQQEQKVTELAKRSTDVSETKRSNLSGINFGRYYAVVIGNNNYANVSNLKTAVNDARAVASVLKGQYGFKTIVVSDASRGRMLAALNSLRKRLTSRDNLVIYFAGHGRSSGGRGFWLPVDAQAGDKKTWISNEQVTNFIDAMKAKHVLVVADSVYSGTLSQSSIPRPVSGSGRNRAWFEAVANTKVRVAMSSGTDNPVQGSGNHSVFTGAFLNALRSAKPIMEGAGLFQLLRQQANRALSARARYAPIRFAGHEAGDFIFLKRGSFAALEPEPEPENDDDKTIKRHLFALREFLLAFKA